MKGNGGSVTSSIQQEVVEQKPLKSCGDGIKWAVAEAPCTASLRPEEL